MVKSWKDNSPAPKTLDSDFPNPEEDPGADDSAILILGVKKSLKLADATASLDDCTSRSSPFCIVALFPSPPVSISIPALIFTPSSLSRISASFRRW
eukprot:CAMPEP_0175046456 /NCGR_PEP_ID=MMETSP0052_2-20121109/5043_1 /TAXON_ID=51329 ORGANISM="Polytomella parva, Strain SAG 63-3" /NCGR_SAMPLE_ID=MMETSP0052_2 /ASSEMBLY_ACC=CAM_ASM_000194 /LENGTH=96 /DNA_ID=CAMNT_0016310209 /DNA_START=172 /DNA_END=459 /DNA_ORIENTATION=+